MTSPLNSREFLAKETHDKLCGCGSGTYLSKCHTRATVEAPINTAYKYGQVSILAQVVKSLNNQINYARLNGQEEVAVATELAKEAIVRDLDTETR